MKREISADIVDENSYLEYLEQHPVYFFGNGAAKCREKITHPNAHFIDGIGYHVHTNESETYYILKGTARFNDNGTEHILCPGDVAFTGSGDGHGIEALEGPVEMIALILYENEPSQ